MLNKFNLSILIYIRFEHPTDISRNVSHVRPVGATWSRRPMIVILLDETRNALTKVSGDRNPICGRSAECRASRRRSRSAYTRRRGETREAALLDDDGSRYSSRGANRAVGVTGAQSSATARAFRKQIVIPRCDCSLTGGKKMTEGERKRGGKCGVRNAPCDQGGAG